MHLSALSTSELRQRHLNSIMYVRYPKRFATVNKIKLLQGNNTVSCWLTSVIEYFPLVTMGCTVKSYIMAAFPGQFTLVFDYYFN